ncbi:ABC transporter G family member 36-like [Daucus carota subsp. sativus]|uniref:ABC transporter G family member 36-like n=1 Tax=Daucus carota subsp. sativus TaxID=79200 RepID=UPI0030826C71
MLPHSLLSTILQSIHDLPMETESIILAESSLHWSQIPLHNFHRFDVWRTRQDLFNSMGSMYSAVVFIGIQNTIIVQPVVAVERTVFYRERAAGMYSSIAYALAQVVVEVPHVLVQTVVYGAIVYSMIGFEWSGAKFFWYLLFMFATLLYYTFYGMMTVALTPNLSLATILAGSLFGIWNLFSGFVIPVTPCSVEMVLLGMPCSVEPVWNAGFAIW